MRPARLATPSLISHNSSLVDRICPPSAHLRPGAGDDKSDRNISHTSQGHPYRLAREAIGRWCVRNSCDVGNANSSPAATHAGQRLAGARAQGRGPKAVAGKALHL